jgi:hypothetical protein
MQDGAVNVGQFWMQIDTIEVKISPIAARISTSVSLYASTFYIRFSSNKMQKDSFSL